ncbi:MAG: zinc ribbon domain-containing protein [Acidobacteriota bacterium]|nr:MAG: zinc ribbon domain-containing protein [Acidobacteriota bacterium]
MPIYEFYCPDCHKIFSFFSRAVNTRKRPACPQCARERLTRRVSLFAISRGLSESAEDEMPDIDESKLERAMASMAQEAEGLDEEDPRQAARMMRRLSEATGLSLGGRFEEALRRMEAGEDPDAIEEELGDLEGDDDDLLVPTGRKRISALVRKLRAPEKDPKLYEL